MKSTQVMAGVAMAVALVMSLAGCSSSARLSGANMCKAAGGTYSPASHTCDAPAINKKSAEAMCQAHGGQYLAGDDLCEITGTPARQ